jgi:hypothetical protein
VIRILRTIAIIDAVAVAMFAAIGWVSGMTPSQTLGAGVIGFAAIGLVLGWRAIVNAPQARRERRDEWAHLGCDPVAPRLSPPAPKYRIERAEPKLLEAPQTKEIELWHT